MDTPSHPFPLHRHISATLKPFLTKQTTQVYWIGMRCEEQARAHLLISASVNGPMSGKKRPSRRKHYWLWIVQPIFCTSIIQSVSLCWVWRVCNRKQTRPAVIMRVLRHDIKHDAPHGLLQKKTQVTLYRGHTNKIQRTLKTTNSCSSTMWGTVSE